MSTADCLVVHRNEDVDRYLELVRDAAAKIRDWIRIQDGDPLDLIRSMKFETAGFHPILGHPLNAIEQINQTWTFIAALRAAKHLLELHPDAGGFHMAPGAHAAIDLDIMSVNPGLVGAEIFATVEPRNNSKMKNDLLKLASRRELHRYNFLCPHVFQVSNVATSLNNPESKCGL